jgi:uncharacterized protein YkwD
MVYIFALAIIIFIIVGVTAKRVQNVTYNYNPIPYYDLSVEEKIFIQLVNDHRKSLGLKPLTPEKLASEVCYNQTLSDIMNDENTSHEHWDRMRRDAKVNLDNCSHIHANNYSSAEGMFKAYLISDKGHKEALENPNRTHIGTSFMQRKNHTLITQY